MPTHFDLIISADFPKHAAEFRLRDASGVQLGFRRTDFKTISVSHQHGLCDLRNCLRLDVEAGKERAAVLCSLVSEGFGMRPKMVLWLLGYRVMFAGR